VVLGTVPRMTLDLTSVQRRTLHDLVDVDGGALFDLQLESRLRERIEREVGPFAPPTPLRLSKERLNDLGRCQGLFSALVAGEGEPFRYGARSARGTLVHKAIELEVGSRTRFDPHELATGAAARLEDDRQFGAYWAQLDDLDRDGLLMEAVRTLESFRASFPPLHEVRRLLAPVSEHWLEASFASGSVTILGKVDLVLNRPDPVRATRVLIDLKSGRAWPDHPEDMRLYALLYTLRYGVPPFRVATLFLDSGQPQSETVTEETLEHAADRVIGAIRTMAVISEGPALQLRAGPHCRRCPRRPLCPTAAQAERGGGALDPTVMN
jgi:CRISPR/Cas system-associated exonuclease Cas4 (RecB family)